MAVDFVRFPLKLSSRDRLRVAKEVLGTKGKVFMRVVWEGQKEGVALAWSEDEPLEELLKVSRVLKKALRKEGDTDVAVVGSAGERLFVIARRKDVAETRVLPKDPEALEVLAEHLSKFPKVIAYLDGESLEILEKKTKKVVPVVEVNVGREDWEDLIEERELLRELLQRIRSLGEKRPSLSKREAVLLLASGLLLLGVFLFREAKPLLAKKEEQKPRKPLYPNLYRNLAFLEEYGKIKREGFFLLEWNSGKVRVLRKGTGAGATLKAGGYVLVEKTLPAKEKGTPAPYDPGLLLSRFSPALYVKQGSCDLFFFDPLREEFLEEVLRTNRNVILRIVCGREGESCSAEVKVCG